MSYNGSGTFQINTSGQPVVTGTVISSSAFNALTADLATGLSTAITKDGQTATTVRIPFAQGINSSLATDTTSGSTGSIYTAGGVGITKGLFVGGTATFSATPVFSALTASSAVATDASKNLVSVANTGTGSNVLSASPTLTGTIAGASLSLSSLTSGRVPYATTAGLLTNSANLLYSGTDLTVYGLTVGRGGSAVATNTAVGSDALLNTTGGQNVAIGYQALTANTSGGTSVAVGYQALDANTTGDSLVAMGWGALGANTTGSSSVAVGRGALQSATTSSYNTAIGRDALFSNTGAENTAVGGQAGQSNTGSTGLVFVGFSAGQLNTGAQNTGVGFNALQNNTTGQGSTALGYRAAYNSTGNFNTALGYSSGSAITTGASNVILGSYTGSAAPISATGSNYVVLSDGDGNVRQSINGSGIVTMGAYGVGTATFSAAGVISSVSDETWKIKDGVPVDTDAMLQKLEPGYWFYNDEKKEIFGTNRQLGFYAQNVNAAIGPEAAPIPEEGKPWGYYDRSVLAVTVMSLQKALATIESLTARIAALETQ